MSKIINVGIFNQANCDVCGQTIKFTLDPASVRIVCSKCDSILMGLANNSDPTDLYWELVEVGYLVLESWKPDEKGSCKYAKHLDGNKHNNRLENLVWSSKPDL